jgi:hypothetical protein
MNRDIESTGRSTLAMEDREIENSNSVHDSRSFARCLKMYTIHQTRPANIPTSHKHIPQPVTSAP